MLKLLHISFFCWGFIGPLSFFDFVIPVFFLPELFLLWLQSAGCPSFVSLLHRFWLNGRLFWGIITACIYDYSEPSLSLFFCKDLFGAICYALGSTEGTTLPQVMIKGFKFRKEKLLLLWLRGVDEGLSSL